MELAWVKRNSYNDLLLANKRGWKSFESTEMPSIPLEYFLELIQDITCLFEIRNVNLKVKTSPYDSEWELYITYDRLETEDECCRRINVAEQKIIQDKLNMEKELDQLRELTEKYGSDMK